MAAPSRLLVLFVETKSTCSKKEWLQKVIPRAGKRKKPRWQR